MVIYLYNLNHLRKVHIRLHQDQMRKEGSCDGLGDYQFVHAPRCKRVETD